MSKTMTKIVRLDLKFVDTDDMKYAEFYEAARFIQNQIRSAKNFISSALYFDLMNDRKIECGYKQDGNKKSLRQACLDLSREEIPYLNSANVNAISDKVCSEFSSKLKRKELLSGVRAAPTYKGNQPIEIRNQAIALYYENNHFILKISFFSKEGAKEYHLKTGEIRFEIIKTKNFQNAILERLVIGEYAIAGSALIYDKENKRWIINLGYTFTPEKKDLDPEKILGVDLGICKPFYAATDTGHDTLHVNGGEIEKFRRMIDKRKADLQSAARFASPGHGRKKRLERVEKLNHKIENFRSTKNFTYAKAIVEFAVQHGCGTIQMEDLSQISTKNKMLKTWSYFDLQTKIEHKANEVGITVRKVNPKFTSQRCHKCGCIDSASRISQEKFVCTTCGHKMNADENAARNIAMKGVEDIMRKQCEVQHLKYDKETH